MQCNTIVGQLISECPLPLTFPIVYHLFVCCRFFCLFFTSFGSPPVVAISSTLTLIPSFSFPSPDFSQLKLLPLLRWCKLYASKTHSTTTKATRVELCSLDSMEWMNENKLFQTSIQLLCIFGIICLWGSKVYLPYICPPSAINLGYRVWCCEFCCVHHLLQLARLDLIWFKVQFG